jgi:ComF family protein
MRVAAGVSGAWRRAGAFARELERRISPHSCVFCGVELAAGCVPVCQACHSELPWLGAACPRCGRSLPRQPGPEIVCGVCQLEPPAFSAIVAPLRYDFPVDAAIKALKFHRRLHYLPAFAALLAVGVRDLPRDIDAMLPVPLHWRRQLARGFNQAAELCRALEPVLPVPVLDAVVRVRSTSYQSGLDASARQANLRGAFRLRGRPGAAHVLIVDDVVTTGATAGRLAAVLRAGGVRRVSVLAIARASRRD